MKTNNNTVKTTSIVIVARNSIAVAASEKYGTDKDKMYTKTGTTNTIARLKVLKDILNNTPTNENYKEVEEPKLIVLESCEISGLAHNGQTNFLRTHKTALGKDFTQEEIDLLEEVCFMLAERSLNVIIREEKYAPKEIRQIIVAAKQHLYDKAKQMITKSNNTTLNCPTVSQATKLVNDIKANIAQLSAEMTKLMLAGKLEEAQQYQQMIVTLQSTIPAESTNEVVVDTNNNTTEEKVADERYTEEEQKRIEEMEDME